MKVGSQGLALSLFFISDGVEDGHSAFVHSSKILIESTREQLSSMHDTSQKLHSETNQSTNSNVDYSGVGKPEKSNSKPNTQIKVVVPICADITETLHKSHSRRKHHKKSTSRSKKATDESLQALTKKYGNHKTGRKTAVLDPLKYLQQLEGSEHGTDTKDKNAIRKKTPSLPLHQDQGQEGETTGHEVAIPKHKTRLEYVRRDSKESTSMALPKIGHFAASDNETCTMNLPGRKITCENCKAKAIKELDLTLPKQSGDDRLSDSTEQVHTSRTVHRHCCAKSSKPAIYSHCSNETSENLPVYIARTFLHNRRILTCNTRTIKSESYYQTPITNLAFHPERYSYPKTYFCIDDLKRKEPDCFAHREILRPNKVTLQSSKLPALITEECLPIDNVSIGFRFRIGKRTMYRIPIALQPEETEKDQPHYESPRRIIPRAKTFCRQYRA
jgi:hypothetical protein